MEDIIAARYLKEQEDKASLTSEQEVKDKFIKMVVNARESVNRNDLDELLKEFPEIEKEIKTMEMFKRISESKAFTFEAVYKAFAHVKRSTKRD